MVYVNLEKPVSDISLYLIEAEVYRRFEDARACCPKGYSICEIRLNWDDLPREFESDDGYRTITGYFHVIPVNQMEETVAFWEKTVLILAMIIAFASVFILYLWSPSWD